MNLFFIYLGNSVLFVWIFLDLWFITNLFSKRIVNHMKSWRIIWNAVSCSCSCVCVYSHCSNLCVCVCSRWRSVVRSRRSSPWRGYTSVRSSRRWSRWWSAADSWRTCSWSAIARWRKPAESCPPASCSSLRCVCVCYFIDPLLSFQHIESTV